MASVAIALLFVLLDQELNSAYIWQLELLSNCPEPYCRPLAKCFVTPGISEVIHHASLPKIIEKLGWLLRNARKRILLTPIYPALYCTPLWVYSP